MSSSQLNHLVSAKVTANRAIVTVATHSCKEGLRSLLASFYKFSDKSKIDFHVFTSNDRDSLPEYEQIPVFWKSGTKAKRQGFRDLYKYANPYAALKPEALMRVAEQGYSSIIWLDGADVLIGEDINLLFDICENKEADIQAHHWMDQRKLHHAAAPTKISMKRWIEPRSNDPYVNNGVIFFRNTPYSKMILTAWQGLLLAPGRRLEIDKPLIGDQEDFNILFRQAWRDGCADLIPNEWNWRGRQAREQVFVDENRKMLVGNHGMQVFLVHASGVGNTPPQNVLEFCTS